MGILLWYDWHPYWKGAWTQREGRQCEETQEEDHLQAIYEERGRDRFSPVPSEREWSCKLPGFRFLASITVRWYISVILSHWFVVFCYSGPSKLMHTLSPFQLVGSHFWVTSSVFYFLIWLWLVQGLLWPGRKCPRWGTSQLDPYPDVKTEAEPWLSCHWHQREGVGEVTCVGASIFHLSDVLPWSQARLFTLFSP